MKKLLLILGMMIPILSNAQNEAPKTALLIIDIQNFYFAGGSSELVNPIPASLNAQKLLLNFRETNQLVIHVKHGDGKGAEIHSNVAPLPGEKVIIKKEVNSFLNTDLLAYLNNNGIKKIVICGMQTNMCLEAATRAASDLDFDCTVIHDACAAKNQTFDGKTVKAEDVHLATLATLKAYAKVISTVEYLEGDRGK
ncbi:MAG: cysteine hydrolase family protein [Bacteroidales bacterium]|nr:cysteine hydrolase family protein [Bacteroidales bacterium]